MPFTGELNVLSKGIVHLKVVHQYIYDIKLHYLSILCSLTDLHLYFYFYFHFYVYFVYNMLSNNTFLALLSIKHYLEWAKS